MTDDIASYCIYRVHDCRIVTNKHITPFSGGANTRTHERTDTPRPHMSGTPLLCPGSAPSDGAKAHWHAHRSPISGLAVPPFGLPRRIIQVLCSLQVSPEPICRSASSTQILQDRCIISAIWHSRSSHASFLFLLSFFIFWSVLVGFGRQFSAQADDPVRVGLWHQTETLCE